jgi:hypothetical protein
VPSLRKKLRDRIAARERQRRLVRISGKPGHRKAVRLHTKAIKKLKRLIAARRIDWNGCEPTGDRKLRAAARVALSVQGVYITSTTGGAHSPGSYHYSGRAIDFGSDDWTNGKESQAQARLVDEFGDAYFTELFGPANWHVKNGSRYHGTFPGHDDHLHVAI